MAAAKAAMAPGASVEDVAKAAGVKVETPESFPRSGPVPGLGSAKALLDAAFSAAVGETKGPVWVPERGAAVLRVLEVIHVAAADGALEHLVGRPQVRHARRTAAAAALARLL